MNYLEFEQGLASARQTMGLADRNALVMAECLVGRLRSVKGFGDRRILVRLKRELADFDAGRKLWKEEK